MVIKLTGFIRDPQNGDNVVATIEYDIAGQMQSPIQRDAPMETINGMSLNQIKAYIISQAQIERGDQMWTSIQTKLNPMLNVDLEAP